MTPSRLILLLVALILNMTTTFSVLAALEKPCTTDKECLEFGKTAFCDRTTGGCACKNVTVMYKDEHAKYSCQSVDCRTAAGAKVCAAFPGRVCRLPAGCICASDGTNPMHDGGILLLCPSAIQQASSKVPHLIDPVVVVASASAATQRHFSAGAIVGMIFGGLILPMLLGTFFWLCYASYKRGQLTEAKSAHVSSNLALKSDLKSFKSSSAADVVA